MFYTVKCVNILPRNAFGGWAQLARGRRWNFELPTVKSCVRHCPSLSGPAFSAKTRLQAQYQVKCDLLIKTHNRHECAVTVLHYSI